MTKADEDDLVIRYAHNYGIDQSTLTIHMVLSHWQLEKALTKRLLQSNPKNRKKEFIACYNKLYNELPWLVNVGDDKLNLPERYAARWKPLLGEVDGKKIYEIGSGNGHLINFLAGQGAICIGTEIAENRPLKTTRPGLEWHETDGVNLTGYEPGNSFDLIISDQVVEHLHPDDINLHFQNAFKLLKSNGKYVFYTPNFYIGPGDVSRIFDCVVAEGMHLKEYKYYELYEILKSAGFKKLAIPNFGENKTVMHLGWTVRAFLLAERSLGLIPNLVIAKKIYHRVRRVFNMPIEIVFVAEK